MTSERCRSFCDRRDDGYFTLSRRNSSGQLTWARVLIVNCECKLVWASFAITARRLPSYRFSGIGKVTSRVKTLGLHGKIVYVDARYCIPTRRVTRHGQARGYVKNNIKNYEKQKGLVRATRARR